MCVLCTLVCFHFSTTPPENSSVAVAEVVEGGVEVTVSRQFIAATANVVEKEIRFINIHFALDYCILFLSLRDTVARLFYPGSKPPRTSQHSLRQCANFGFRRRLMVVRMKMKKAPLLVVRRSLARRNTCEW